MWSCINDFTMDLAMVCYIKYGRIRYFRVMDIMTYIMLTLTISHATDDATDNATDIAIPIAHQ